MLLLELPVISLNTYLKGGQEGLCTLQSHRVERNPPLSQTACLHKVHLGLLSDYHITIDGASDDDLRHHHHLNKPYPMATDGGGT